MINLVLIGLMGSGKSTVGRLLAERLGWPFVDTDAQVEAEAGCSIPQLFASEGEEGFRQREAQVIRQLSQRHRQVIATGGGAVLRPENREALRESGLVIWLDAPPEVLYRRAVAQGVERRPLLAGADPLGRLRELAASRRVAYEATAHHQLSTGDRPLDQVVTEVLALIANQLQAED